MKATLDYGSTEHDQFLVQRLIDGLKGCICTLMDSYSLAEYLNFNDIFDEEYEIWQIGEFGAIDHCHYAGWQPGCHIQVIRDMDGQIVVDTYGVDH